MTEFDQRLRALARAEDSPLPQGFADRLEARLDDLPPRRGRGTRARAPLRAVLAVAVCAALVVSVGAAALLGAFDFMREQDAFALLGLTEEYEKFTYDVGVSDITARGDVFTLEKAAIDSAFCTVFYTYRYAEPQMSQAEFEALDAADPWTAFSAAPQLSLWLDGEEISLEGYDNSFEPQQYFSDPQTVRGMWRCLLTAPGTNGMELELRGWTWDQETRSEEAFSVDFPSQITTGAVVMTPQVTFPISCWGTSHTLDVTVESLKISPLGSLLTLRYDLTGDRGLGLLHSFVLRDGDTGKYIPFARVWTPEDNRCILDGQGVEHYELFGDVEELGRIENLEIVPIWSHKSISEKKTVSLSDLPSSDSGNPAGGYAPASYRVEGNRVIVELQPVGAVSAVEAAKANGVVFLDKDGNEVDLDGSEAKFKNRSTGVITVVTTVENPDFAQRIDQIAGFWFFVEDYYLLEDRAVSVPLPLHLEGW